MVRVIAVSAQVRSGRKGESEREIVVNEEQDLSLSFHFPSAWEKIVLDREMSSDLGKVVYPMRPLTTLPPISPQEVMYKMQNIHEVKFLPIDEHQRRLIETLDTKMPATELDIPEEIIRILKVSVSFLRRATP